MFNTNTYTEVSHYALSKYLDCPVSKVRRRIANKRKKDDKQDKKYYECIENTRIKDIKKWVHYCSIKLGRNIKFLDVGAGMGHILQGLNQYYRVTAAHGVEVESIYCEVFKKEMLQYFIRRNKVKMFNQDAFEFDHYGDYDLIYMYVPIKDHNLMRKLHKKIIKEMKVGSFIVDVGRSIPIDKGSPLVQTSQRLLRRKIK